MAGETFKINFVTNGKGEKVIDEPIGFDSVPFTFKQDDKRYGRDKFFGGDNENEFTFQRMRNHEIDNLLYDLETTGWETENKLIIEKDGIDNIVGDLDYQYATTDQLEYFKCKVIQDTRQALLKRRNELNVDVFSSEDIDGNAITPLNTENVLIKSKPITQTSTWETPEAFDERLFAERAIDNTIYYVFNPAISLTSYDIDDSLTFFRNLEGNTTDASDFKIIEAVNNLRKVKINVTNLDLQIETDVDNGGDGYIDIELIIKYGLDYNTATTETLFFKNVKDGNSYSNTNNYSFEIPSLNRGEGVWLYYKAKVRQSSNTPFGNPRFEAFTTVNSMNVGVTATSIAYNTIAPSIRLKDGISQTVKSISGLTTSFPFAEQGAELYNQRIFSGNMLRNLTDRAFNISFDAIVKWLAEIHGDYEVQNDGTVFIGKYEDFYQNNEIAVFDSVRFDSYNKTMNERYAINQFSYKYEKYQSQKETEVENTFDIAHGETQWNVQNKFVENKKEIAVPFVRCSFYLDEQRRKAFDLNNNTSTQDDETIFILDTKELSQNTTFTETDFLQHTYSDDTGYLKLTNTGNFSFVLLGAAVGEQFTIHNDVNAGIYTIIEVSERYIVLNNNSGDTNNNGERNTEFTYIVSTTTAPYISWSDEGFSYINGIVDTENFANLKYTVKRNIERFYDKYLATCNFYTNKPIKNTLYKNNGTLALNYEGYQTVENGDFTPFSPILSPYKHEITVITDFNTFIDLQNKAKSEKGYVRTFDANGHVIKGYIKEATFKNNENELKLVLEEKHKTSIINIKTGANYIAINNNEYVLRKLTYKIDNEKMSLMDEHGLLLYNPIFWQKVTVNGAISESKEDLISKLQLLE